MVKPVSGRKSDTVKSLNLRNARQAGILLYFYVMQYLFITSEVVLMNYILRELQSEI
ncbi:hypothetical protein ECP03047993_5546 [Escherichia coli P0304799.3]|nr:hypothetical protein ECP03047993_5546 [Escherichia coli P0304799.3]